MTTINVREVTLLAVSSILIPETIEALQKSMEGIKWGAVKLVTDECPKDLPENIEFAKCPKINNIMDYNHYVFRDLTEHVDTSHCLMVQYHSWILNYWMWNDFWLDYDYLGCTWDVVPNTYIADNGNRIRVGNGGFSLRSKRLLDAPKKLGLELKQEQGWFNEDGNICCYHRSTLLDYGIKYGSIESSVQFGYEKPMKENNFGQQYFFGFHKNLPDKKYIK